MRRPLPGAFKHPKSPERPRALRLQLLFSHPRTSRLLRYFCILAVILLLLDLSSLRGDAGARSYLPQLPFLSSNSDGNIVWANDTLYRSLWDVNERTWQFTHLHSNVITKSEMLGLPKNGTTDVDDGELTLEVLSYLERQFLPGKMEIRRNAWQIWDQTQYSIVKEIRCIHDDGPQASHTVARTIGKAFASLVQCDIPPTAKDIILASHKTSALDFAITLEFTFNDESVYSTQIRLSPSFVESSAGRSAEESSPSMAICVNPIYGKVSAQKLVEWRLHHAHLGIKTVHWYERPEGFNRELEELVHLFNANMRLKDTYGPAPAISPQTYKTEALEEEGLYGDQILYYMDCNARSRHTYPTDWLALTDLDEFIQPISIEPLQDFKHSIGLWSKQVKHVLANVTDNTSALCIFRSMTSQESILAASTLDSDVDEDPNAKLSLASTLNYKLMHAGDGVKCFYRSRAIEVPAVHGHISFREGYNWKVSWGLMPEAINLHLLHISHKRPEVQPTPFPREHLAHLRNYLLDLRQIRDHFLITQKSTRW